MINPWWPGQTEILMPQSRVWIVRFFIHKLLSPACLHLKLFFLKTRVRYWIVFRASRKRFAVNQFRIGGPNMTVSGFFNTQAKINLIECNLTCFQNESETAIESEVKKVSANWPGGELADGAMRTLAIVFHAPLLDELPSMAHRHEPMLVQALPVETSM